MKEKNKQENTNILKRQKFVKSCYKQFDNHHHDYYSYFHPFSRGVEKLWCITNSQEAILLSCDKKTIN